MFAKLKESKFFKLLLEILSSARKAPAKKESAADSNEAKTELSKKADKAPHPS